MTFKYTFLFVFMFSAVTVAQNVYTTGDILSGWQSQSRNDVMIRNSNNACHRVDSALAGKNFFIPTRNPSEWSAVNANKPSGLAITPCVCEPLVIDTASCAIANGSGSRQCWTNGAAWTACNQACNVGYTLTAGVCVSNVTYVHRWRTYMPSAHYEYFSNAAIPTETRWYLLDEFCDKEIVGANPYNAGAVGVADAQCIIEDRPRNPARCSWLDYNTQSTMIWQCR